MVKENKIIVAIILGAAIIGVCIFAGIYYKPSSRQVVAGSSNTVTGEESAPIKSSDGAEKISPSASAASCGADNNTIVTKVIDGDTVIVEGGFHVRLLGIDADEKNYPCYGPAKNRLETLVLGKQVRLEKDITDVDQYGRCLRTIFAGPQNIDAQLVREGLAVARFYAPDVKYGTEISMAEKQAIAGKMGCKWEK